MFGETCLGGLYFNVNSIHLHGCLQRRVNEVLHLGVKRNRIRDRNVSNGCFVSLNESIRQGICQTPFGLDVCSECAILIVVLSELMIDDPRSLARSASGDHSEVDLDTEKV